MLLNFMPSVSLSRLFHGNPERPGPPSQSRPTVGAARRQPQTSRGNFVVAPLDLSVKRNFLRKAWTRVTRLGYSCGGAGGCSWRLRPIDSATVKGEFDASFRSDD